MIRLLFSLASLPVLLPLLSGAWPLEFRTAESASPPKIVRPSETDLLKARVDALQERVVVLNQSLAESLAALEPSSSPIH
ncbi:MAG TPA: hypothetical protein VLJ37_12205 [bacterium]|nr:hypothetical protein [bacterium]